MENNSHLINNIEINENIIQDKNDNNSINSTDSTIKLNENDNNSINSKDSKNNELDDNKNDEIKLSILALVFDKDFNTFIENLNINLIHDIPDELIVVLAGSKFLDYDKLINFENKYNLLFKNFKLIKFEKRKSDEFLFIEGSKHISYDNISVIFGRNYYHKQRNKIIKYFFKNYDAKILIHSYLYEYCWRQNKLINTLYLNQNLSSENNYNEDLLNNCQNFFFKQKELNNDSNICLLCNKSTKFSINCDHTFCLNCLSQIYMERSCLCSTNPCEHFPKCPLCNNLNIDISKNNKSIINEQNYHHYFIDEKHYKSCINCKNSNNQIYFKNINEDNYKDIEFIDNDKLKKYNFNHDLINPGKKILFGKINNEQILPDTLSFSFKKELIDLFLFFLETDVNLNNCNNGFQNLLINYLLKENYKIILLNSKLSLNVLYKKYPQEIYQKHLEKSNFKMIS